MNLQLLTPSRRRQAAGDVFVTPPPDDRFVFGRVIRTDAAGTLGGGCVLIYIRTIDDEVSEALGIPLAADEQDDAR